MAQAEELISVLKKALKAQGLTYADVAAHLDLSEASVKRMFAQQLFTLERLEAIGEMMHLDFADLVRMADDERTRISSLTEAQEQELVSDLKFLLVATCTQNAWSFQEIIDYYNFTEPECIGYLVRLDRLGVIQLLPGNRYRRMVSQDFRWLSRGPIERFFEERVQRDFLNSHFTRPGEMRLFVTGMLTPGAVEEMLGRLESVVREFASLHRDELHLTASERLNTGLMLAIRPWELRVFTQFRRRAG